MSDVVPIMTKARAQLLVRLINEKAAELRRMLAELHDLKGWQALGYASWRDCVISEFGQSMSQLYRELAAARTEENLPDFAHVRKSERSLRPIAELPAELQSVAYGMAMREAELDGSVAPQERHTRAVATVISGLLVTGGFSSVDGAATPLDAELVETQVETVMRQREYLRTATTAKRGELLAAAECFLADRSSQTSPYQSLTVYIDPKDAPNIMAGINAGGYLSLIVRKKD